jgi:hypothetical protein
MPYALCPMPYALCQIVPHVTEKGYITLSTFGKTRASFVQILSVLGKVDALNQPLRMLTNQSNYCHLRRTK